MTDLLDDSVLQLELPQGTIRYRDSGGRGRGDGDSGGGGGGRGGGGDDRGDGGGEPIVFLHGALCNGGIWRGVIPELAGDYRCIAPDLPKGSHLFPMHADADLTPPGMVRLVVGFLDALGLDRVIVVGNDSGGAIAQMLAAAYPDRIGRLILTSCDTFGQFPPRYLKPLHPLTFVPGLGASVARLWYTKPVRRLFFWSIVKHGLAPDVLDSYVEPLRDPGVRRDVVKFFRGTAPRHTRQAARRLATFTRPTLIAWSADDLWFRRNNGKRLARTIPGATFTLIPDARTFVPEDQPTELARTIHAFLTANSTSHPVQ
ncbi:alpha/beta hydrolase [Kribbella solani]|uniref:alpha/beta fold hydrolase n=1 Tax=Kribbella solani TaxID=236067 RepID=UPI0029A4DE08|nr:alpha/beta hydrolase [Kribbella solani]MDX2971312.1 alpha/beta hydrolase [Kribbella solani]MDX3005574.1 alpha/beta hydrolase [Kribbella solani]